MTKKCFINNARRFGPHLQTVSNVSDSQCYDKCLETSECKSFDYKKSSRTCLLKKRGGKFRKVDGYKTTCKSFKQKPLFKTIWKDNWDEPRTIGKVMVDPKDPKSKSGFTLVTMSKHDNYKQNACDASSYYMRLWHDGYLGFQQEFKHEKRKQYYGNYKINGKRGVQIFRDGIPKDKWIGLKMKVEKMGNTAMLKGYTNIDKKYLVRPDKWWKERAIISRALIYKKKYETAYKISSNHALSEGPEFAEAEWMSGWIALSFLNDPLLAIEHFNNFYNNVGYPISLSRGAYWLGRAYEKLNKKELSNKWYNEASKFLTTYYGQLAFLKINPNKEFSLNEMLKIDHKYKKKFYEKSLVKIVYLLDELNKDKYAKDILKHLANENIENGSEILTAELATSISRYDFAIQISKIASYQKRFHNDFNYPIISTPCVCQINEKFLNQLLYFLL